MTSSKKKLGFHYIWDISNASAEALSFVPAVEKLLSEISSAFNLTVLSRSSNQFAPHGATAIFLLAESHLSIHTWPEENYAAVDLFSCVPLDETVNIQDTFSKHLGLDIVVHERVVERMVLVGKTAMR